MRNNLSITNIKHYRTNAEPPAEILHEMISSLGKSIANVCGLTSKELEQLMQGSQYTTLLKTDGDVRREYHVKEFKLLHSIDQFETAYVFYKISPEGYMRFVVKDKIVVNAAIGKLDPNGNGLPFDIAGFAMEVFKNEQGIQVLGTVDQPTTKLHKICKTLNPFFPDLDFTPYTGDNCVTISMVDKDSDGYVDAIVTFNLGGEWVAPNTPKNVEIKSTTVPNNTLMLTNPKI